ncbi:14699_t:CDS:1, partial [Acaulospora morrowiae]
EVIEELNIQLGKCYLIEDFMKHDISQNPANKIFSEYQESNINKYRLAKFIPLLIVVIKA